ncbi:hypothetical protein JCM9279_003359 [Rhodotorula babjevae]
MPISSSSSHTFKQRWELLKPTLAASTSSDDSTSSSASSSSPRFPPVGLRTHYPNPYSARRYDAVDLDAMAKMSASKPPARRSSKAREKEAAALPAQSEPMQVDRQTSEAAAGEAASPEQIQDEAGRTHEAKVEPASKKRRLSSSSPSSSQSVRIWRKLDNTKDDASRIMIHALNALQTREPAVLAKFTTGWSCLDDDKLYNKDDVAEISSTIRKMRCNPAVTSGSELSTLEELHARLERAYLRDQAQHMRSFRANQFIQILEAYNMQLYRAGHLCKADYESFKASVREEVVAALGAGFAFATGGCGTA